MLIEFRIKNFKSYKDEQVLSLVSSGNKDESLPDNLINADFEVGENISLLSSAAIYGPNASGKSNLINAVRFVEKLVAHPQSREIRKKGGGIEIEPFLLSKDTRTAPTEFELTFIQEGVRYQYGFSLNSQRILEEWLLAYPQGSQQRWFERTIKDSTAEKPEYEWYFQRNKHRKSRELIKDKTRLDALFLPVAVEFNDEPLIVVYNWFLHNLNYLYTENFNPVFTISQVDQSERIKSQVANLLREADLGIADFVLEKADFDAENLPSDLPDNMREEIVNGLKGSKSVKVRLQHFTDEPDKLVGIALENESFGTRRLFELSGWILKVLEEGYALFVDELDASLHPLLVEKLIRLFNDKALNQKGAQLIFNTHNISLLRNDAQAILRRDQIWFVEKQADGASKLYPLTDIRPRKGEALEKNYREGRYGAIPIIGQLVESRTA